MTDILANRLGNYYPFKVRNGPDKHNVKQPIRPENRNLYFINDFGKSQSLKNSL